MDCVLEGLLCVLLESMAVFLNSVSDKAKEDPKLQNYLKQLERSYLEAIQSFQQEVQEVKKQQNERIEAEVRKRV